MAVSSASPDHQGASAAPSVRVLVVEDEGKVAGALREGLEGEGYEVVVETTGEDAFFRLAKDRFDVILLDLMLPGRDGLEVLTALRRQGVDTPVVVLTARDTLQDRVIGLDAGADDYLVKPFAFEELLARIRAVGRRGRVADTDRLGLDTLEIDRATRQVARAGHSIELTAKEFDLLQYLARNVRQVVSRDTLAREVWRETSRSTTLDNVIDVPISRLRRKLDLNQAVKLIHTVRGVGFVLREGDA
ncbi:MAG: response regulator transcription factor [Vicinamibacterales bacterium]|nr:response regulator transcription factor [Vicinamibacterales bacterium]MDP7691226.1 response regulator transcription factor [Vicinamibacterales bacterium]HJN46253.1 response regulator transcription factor [Vicinamibacterales bacterium]